MQRVVITDKWDWHYAEYLQQEPREGERHFKGWAYELVSVLMDDSFLLDKKGDKEKRKAHRRMKKIIRRAFKQYRRRAENEKKIFPDIRRSIALYCLFHFGWRVRKHRQGEIYYIESN